MHLSPHRTFLMFPYTFFLRPVNRLSTANEKCYVGDMGTLMDNILESSWAVPASNRGDLGSNPYYPAWDLL